MSYAFKQLDTDILNSLSADVEALITEIFGSDFSLSYGVDGSADIVVVGGDINLSGSAIGNTIRDLEELVRTRVTTRLLTYYSESPLLPTGYGSFLTDIVGLTIVDDLNVDVSGNNIQLSDVEAFIKGIIQIHYRMNHLLHR